MRKKGMSSIEIKETDVRSIVGSVFLRIQDLKERFRIYKQAADEIGCTLSPVEGEYKKTISLTLLEIRDIMNRFGALSSADCRGILFQVRDELEECCSILDSCLNSLETGQKEWKYDRGEHILYLEVRQFRGRKLTPQVEIKLIAGTPIKEESLSMERLKYSS